MIRSGDGDRGRLVGRGVENEIDGGVAVVDCVRYRLLGGRGGLGWLGPGGRGVGFAPGHYFSFFKFSFLFIYFFVYQTGFVKCGT